MDEFSCKYGTICYLLTGARTGGAALVFLHGLGSSHHQFDAVAKKLPIDRLVLMIDFPCHGDNAPKADTQQNFSYFTSLVIELCDHLGVEHAVFIGISMGGAVALRCAAMRPDLAISLMIIRPAWLAAAAPDHLALIDRCAEWLTFMGMDDAIRALEHDADYIEMRDDVALSAASVRAVFDRDHAVAHAPVLSALFHSTPFENVSAIRAIKTPTIVVGTHADSFHPIAVAKATTNALPNAELHILPPRYLNPDEHQAALIELITEKVGVAV
mgnify:CR=1 FL=1